jgi:hypothetical protein
MWSWFTFWLTLHVLAVIGAFGPSFSYGIIASLGQKHPEHGAFAVEIIHFIERRMATPLSVAVPLLGTALIYTAHFDLWKSEWLIISIVLYAIAFFFAVLVQTPTVGRLLSAMQAMPPPASSEAAAPPQEVQALVKRVRLGGGFLGFLVVVILVLMIWRPGAAFTG